MNDPTVPFPDNVIEVLAERLAAIDGVSGTFKRPLDQTDPNGSIGISFQGWSGTEYEINGRGNGEPTLSQYVLHIEHFVKHTNREEGYRTHRLVAREIRRMLYRDQDVTYALRELKHISDAVPERYMKLEMAQGFADNKIKEAFWFVSGTTVTITTSTSF